MWGEGQGRGGLMEREFQKGRLRTGYSGEGSVCSEIPILGQNTVID